MQAGVRVPVGAARVYHSLADLHQRRLVRVGGRVSQEQVAAGCMQETLSQRLSLMGHAISMP